MKPNHSGHRERSYPETLFEIVQQLRARLRSSDPPTQLRAAKSLIMIAALHLNLDEPHLEN